MSSFSRELESFRLVAQERSLRHAAKHLNLSASAISRQMAILEQEYGAQLFIRLPRGVQLTEIGQILLAQVDEWKAQEERLRTRMHAEHMASPMKLRLGIMECLANQFVATFHDRMQDLGIDLDLEVSDENSQVLAERLLRQELDIIIAFNVPRLRRVRIIEEMTCALGVVYAPDHAFSDHIARIETPNLSDCLGETLCLPNSSLSFHTKLNAEIARYRKDSRILLRSNSIILIRDYVARGKGITFLNWHDVWSDVASGRLSFARLNNRRLTDTLSICTVSGLRLAPQFTRALKELRTTLASLGET